MAYYHGSFHPQPLPLLIESSKSFPGPLPGFLPTVKLRTDLGDSPSHFLRIPRELRDLAYSYTFHHRGLCYRDRIGATTRWSRRRTSASYINLLLTSRQIHTEALSTLFRTQKVEISPRRSSWRRSHLNPLTLSHVLCSFPLAPARLISRLQIAYSEYSIYLPSAVTTFPKASDGDLMFALWKHIVRDGWTLKEHFPRLNRFEARSRQLGEKMGCAFFTYQDDYYTLDEPKRRQIGEQVTSKVVSWLDSKLRGTELVPPRWLKVTFSDELEASDSHVTFLRFQHEVIHLAHLLLEKKRVATHDEKEESGKVWLEGCSMKRKRGRKGWSEEVDI